MSSNAASKCGKTLQSETWKQRILRNLETKKCRNWIILANDWELSTGKNLCDCSERDSPFKLEQTALTHWHFIDTALTLHPLNRSKLLDVHGSASWTSWSSAPKEKIQVSGDCSNCKCVKPDQERIQSRSLQEQMSASQWLSSIFGWSCVVALEARIAQQDTTIY